MTTLPATQNFMGASPLQVAGKATGMDPISLTFGIGGILSSLFGNLFGAKKQADTSKQIADSSAKAQTRAAELEYQALTDALNYQKQTDARDYRDWLAREARDRRDYEATELRRAPYRALGDSAVRTLADYTRVPGQRPAQEVPVPIWSDANAPPMMGEPRTLAGYGPNESRPMGANSQADLSNAMGMPPGSIQTMRRPRTFRDFAGYA